MKLHYRNTHPEVFPTLQRNINRINRVVERSATACVRCHYCGESQRDWKAHPLKCTTIWQCAVICVLQDPDHVRWCQRGPGDGRVLRCGEEQRHTETGASMEQANAKRRRENQPSSKHWEHDHHNHSGGYGQNRWHGNYYSTQHRDPLVYSLARLVVRLAVWIRGTVLRL